MAKDQNYGSGFFSGFHVFFHALLVHILRICDTLTVQLLIYIFRDRKKLQFLFQINILSLPSLYEKTSITQISWKR